ncbi:MAG: hypothetical protein AAGI48_16275 [Verrucomicrobiota bacterium]
MSTTARSPLSGCTILVLAVLMLLFLIGFSAWTPFRQAAEMEKFTRAEAAPVPVLSPNETEAEAFHQRLGAFRDAVTKGDEEARLELDIDDLNLAVAVSPALKELRETFHVRAIEDGKLVIDICYQLNGPPRFTKEGEDGWITSDPRYLVGTIYGRPILTKRELVLRVDRLEVPDAEVAEGFMNHFSTLRIFEQSLQDPQIGPVMAKLTAASLEDGALVLARVPGDPVPDVVSDEAFARSGGKIALFLGGAALIFILLAGGLLYVGYRKQLQKLQEAEQTDSSASDAEST